jgi:hypothetical protein
MFNADMQNLNGRILKKLRNETEYTLKAINFRLGIVHFHF